jgi:peptidoglycan/LPS O-acetylase OafA/YrhL
MAQQITPIHEVRPPLPALTGLRFFAAAYIILFHTRFAQDAATRNIGLIDIFLSSGFLAVTLFFLLSGFILAYVYEGRTTNAHGKRHFWQARLARIWPLYAASLLFVSLLMHLTPPSPIAAAVLLMVQAWNPFNPTMAQAWSGVCWTLSVEAFFYLLFPFVQSWLDRRSQQTIAVVLALNVALCLVFNICWRTPGYPIYGAYRFIPLALLHTPEFLIGVLVGNLYLRRTRSTHARQPRAVWFTYIAAAASLALLCVRNVPTTSFAVLTFAALLFGLATEATLLRRFLSLRTVVFGGEISYAMYLLHFPCRTIADTLSDHLRITAATVRFGAYFTATVLASIVAHKTIEVPARNLVRRLGMHREKARAASRSKSSAAA